jgi:hypothetical protein
MRTESVTPLANGATMVIAVAEVPTIPTGMIHAVKKVPILAINFNRDKDRRMNPNRPSFRSIHRARLSRDRNL